MILSIILSLITISIIDIIFLRIPNWLNIILFLNALSYVIWYDLGQYYLGSIIGLGIFLIGYIMSKGSLGEGDIKLIPSLGLLIGFPGILNLILYSSLLSLTIFNFNKKRKAQVLPFAPFLSVVFIFLFILQSSSF
ncbi:MAG: leader peptidase (prepilin peptidase) / N-methyltransferase [Fusobacteria bacterium]|nr:MAG: leader peptidase (prepilin peptidase) / N-methyltransferase [Fusobacteriota bacterium]KAF0230115.1 MAG: leader peptidase (prepilin peptidase) [Fusobacteriota bacterium]